VTEIAAAPRTGDRPCVRLAGSHLVPSVRGELLARLGRRAEACREFELAAGLCGNEAERALLRRKAALAR
jgi:predicted RNA polymerase sigma factor